MCAFSPHPCNVEYARDLLRGRIRHPRRFWRIEAYAYQRWQKTRDMAAARRWLAVMDAAKRRLPL